MSTRSMDRGRGVTGDGVLWTPPPGPRLDYLLFGYWSLDEASGTRVRTLGTGPNLLEVGGTVPSTTGRTNLAAHGVSEAATVGLAATTSINLVTGLTVAFWFYWPMWPSNNPNCLFALDTGDGLGNIVRPWVSVGRYYGSDFLDVSFSWDVGKAVALPLPRLGDFSQNAWHLVVVTYDPSTGKFVGMVDQGCLSTARDWGNYPLFPAYKLSTSVAPADLSAANAAVFTDIRLLKSWQNAVSFEGRIDSLRIWPRVLTPEEIEKVWLSEP